MIRTLVVAALAAAGLSAPAYAAETEMPDAKLAAIHAAALANVAQANQAKQILAQKGYVNVSITGRDDDGRWTGLAYKDGKTVFVAVELPRPQVAVTN